MESDKQHVKWAFEQLDNDLASLLMEVAQFALNDCRAIKRVAEDLELTQNQVCALAGIAIDVSCNAGSPLSITSKEDYEAEVKRLEQLEREFS